MNNPGECFICGKRVLGLRGQDLLLDTFALRDEEQDRQAIAENAFGECHIFCLASSKWGNFWATRYLQNYRDVRRLKFVFVDDRLTILRNDRMKESVVIRSDGRIAIIADRRLASVDESSAPEGVLLPVSDIVSIDLPVGLPDLGDLERSLNATDVFPLWQLVESLGIANELQYPTAIKDGEIRPDVGAKTTVEHSATSVRLNAVLLYHEFLPPDVAIRLLEYQ